MQKISGWLRRGVVKGTKHTIVLQLDRHEQGRSVNVYVATTSYQLASTERDCHNKSEPRHQPRYQGIR